MASAARGRDKRGVTRGARRRPDRQRDRSRATAEWPDILRALDEEHHYQQRVLGMLEKQVAALNQRREPDYEVMHGVMRYMTNYPDRFHHPKEDLVFNKVMERDPSSTPEVQRLLKDHVEIIARGAELLAVIDRCRADPGKADTHALRKSAHAYVGYLRRHMDVETLRFFPRACEVLRAGDWAEVDAQMKPVLDPVFGDQVADEFHTLRAHEDRTQSAGRRRVARFGWVEATAALESFSALLAGATKANASLSRHHRKALVKNLAIVREIFSAHPCSRRVGLVRKACTSNSTMAGDITRELRSVWSEAFKAARRPYREKETYAARLSDTFSRLMRRVPRPSVARPSSGK